MCIRDRSMTFRAEGITLNFLAEVKKDVSTAMNHALIRVVDPCFISANNPVKYSLSVIGVLATETDVARTDTLKLFVLICQLSQHSPCTHVFENSNDRALCYRLNHAADATVCNISCLLSQTISFTCCTVGAILI